MKFLTQGQGHTPPLTPWTFPWYMKVGKMTLPFGLWSSLFYHNYQFDVSFRSRTARKASRWARKRRNWVGTRIRHGFSPLMTARFAFFFCWSSVAYVTLESPGAREQSNRRRPRGIRDRHGRHKRGPSQHRQLLVGGRADEYGHCDRTSQGFLFKRDELYNILERNPVVLVSEAIRKDAFRVPMESV